MRRKDHELNGIRCECGSIDRMVFHGPRDRKTREPVQSIRCGVCGRTKLAEYDQHPLARQRKERDVLINILGDLAKGKSIRKTATKNNSSPGTVVKTRDGMKEHLKKRITEVSEETGLSPRDILALLQQDSET